MIQMLAKILEQLLEQVSDLKETMLENFQRNKNGFLKKK